MKLKLLLLLLTLSIASGASAQLTGCAFGTIQTFDGFKHTDGGGRVGFITSFDSDRDMYMRVVAGSINLGDEEMKTIQPTLLMKWYLGKKWDLWWTLGADIYIDGPNTGADAITGLGASRKLKTVNPEWVKPAILYGFVELSFTDASGAATGKYAQLNLGIAFAPGSPK